MSADLNRRGPEGFEKLVTGDLFGRSGLRYHPRTNDTRKVVWPEPGITDTRIGCHDETGDSLGDDGVCRAAAPRRRISGNQAERTEDRTRDRSSILNQRRIFANSSEAPSFLDIGEENRIRAEGWWRVAAAIRLRFQPRATSVVGGARNAA